jgi:hypothetical protein
MVCDFGSNMSHMYIGHKKKNSETDILFLKTGFIEQPNRLHCLFYIMDTQNFSSFR